MRLVIAVAIGLVILVLGVGTLRGFLGPRGGSTSASAAEPPPPLPVGVRVLYWCENCGTEVLLLRAGSEAAPRHCGEAMTRREEVSRN